MPSAITIAINEHFVLTRDDTDLLRIWLLFDLPFLVVFVLKTLEYLAFARGFVFAAGACVCAREREVHLGTRRREFHAFFQLFDRAIDLAQLEQHAAEH